MSQYIGREGVFRTEEGWEVNIFDNPAFLHGENFEVIGVGNTGRYMLSFPEVGDLLYVNEPHLKLLLREDIKLKWRE